MKFTDMTKLLIAALMAASFALTGCDNDGPMEEAGEEIDEAAENVEDSVEDAADDVEDEIDG